MRTTEPGRRHDTRGAITVVAVFMAAVMVAALWYVIGIGEALLYREQLQDAADAAAYTGAVYHARGMNLIALINVVMAAIVAVMVALRLVELLNLAAMVLSCAASSLCSVGVGCWAVPICSFTTDLRPEIAAVIRRYDQGVIRPVLPALGQSQRGVALGMPAVAQAQAARVAGQRSGPAEATGILGPSLAPPVPAARLGLPVERGDYAALCERAGEDVAEVAFDPFPFGDWLAEVTGSMVSTFPAHFCGGGERPSVMDESGAVDEQCRLRRQAHEAAGGDDFDLEECRGEVRRELGDAFAEGARGLEAGGGDLARAAPMQPFAPARNGSGWMQVWGVAVGDPATALVAEAGVRVAVADGPPRADGARWGRVSLAQAEFFYDTDRDWDVVREEALWNLRWKARLRRLRPPGVELRGALGVAVRELPTALGRTLSGAAECELLLGGRDGGAGEVIH